MKKVAKPKEKVYTLAQLRLLNDCDKTTVEKIVALRMILESNNVDSERTLLGSEPLFEPIVSRAEAKKIKEKLFQLIEQL